MSVDDWARRKAEKSCGIDSPERATFADGIVHAFDALLSDEAATKGAQILYDNPDAGDVADFRDVVEAAVRAVTEGESK